MHVIDKLTCKCNVYVTENLNANEFGKLSETDSENLFVNSGQLNIIITIIDRIIAGIIQ